MIRRLVFPAVLGLAFTFLFAPIVMIVLASFNGGAVLSFPPRAFSTYWYGTINPSYLAALYVSLIVATVTAVIATVIAVPGALALVRGRFPGKSVMTAACVSPLAVPALVAGVALFQYFIVLADVLGLPLGATIPGLVVGHLTFAIPFVLRAVIAAHARFDMAIEEAAQNLGAGPFRTFFAVTLPILRPGIISGAIFAFLMSLDDVPIALFVGGGSATTLPVKILTAAEFAFGGDIMAVASLIIGVSIAMMVILDRCVGLEQFFGGNQERGGV